MQRKDLTPQQQRIVDYLSESGALTNTVALTCLGIGSLSSRIAELRKLGYDITDEMDEGFDGRSFKKYRLRKKEQPSG